MTTRYMAGAVVAVFAAVIVVGVLFAAQDDDHVESANAGTPASASPRCEPHEGYITCVSDKLTVTLYPDGRTKVSHVHGRKDRRPSCGWITSPGSTPLARPPLGRAEYVTVSPACASWVRCSYEWERELASRIYSVNCRTQSGDGFRLDPERGYSGYSVYRAPPRQLPDVFTPDNLPSLCAPSASAVDCARVTLTVPLRFVTPDHFASCLFSRGGLMSVHASVGCTSARGVAVTLSATGRPRFGPACIHCRTSPAITSPVPVGVLGFGEWWWGNTRGEWGKGPGRGDVLFRCESRESGLTCRSRSGHGFWMGRVRGQRVF